ncbi:E3 ubiquitin-protein ligase CCNB1IP1 [Colletotrichum musicola]|uniref:E3 ubiquitin-protein ligase CCNB1IP1 n=1 Tax=Colletotrichum musicola TaxID=2175873 RepID=A0A8H6N736_9PEZI|nr:E3 ubiquitin-protein ligase CCNB1IP1 [Colletotrichum musicola]
MQHPGMPHIFCVECAEKHGLSRPGSEARRICPACNGHLQSPDDAVVANLNLSEEYKTSVLSGLSPSVIMECTGRALSFWAYQANQEEILDQQFQKTIDDANTEIESLRDKLRAQNADYDNLRRKYEELGLSYKDKCRRFAQLQELHNKVKRKAELGQMEAAASYTVDSSFQLGFCPPDVQASAMRRLYEHRASPPHVGAKKVLWPVQLQVPELITTSCYDDLLMARAAGMSRTPRGTPRRDDLHYRSEYGLPNTSSFDPDPPVTRESAITQIGNYIPARQAVAVRGLGVGLGLSSGVRTSHTRTNSSHTRDIHPQSQGVLTTCDF